MPENNLTPRVFMSYSTRNRGFISNLYEDMALIGLKPWIDLIELPAPDTLREENDIRNELRSAIDACDLAILLVNEDALRSTWVEYEIDYIIQSNRLRSEFLFIPIIDDGAPNSLPRKIKKFNPIDFSHGYNTALANLIQRIGISKTESCEWLASGIAEHRSIASRTLETGIGYPKHARSIISNQLLSGYVSFFGPECGRIMSHESSEDIIDNLTIWARTWLERKHIVYGNDEDEPIDNRDGLRMVLSVIPAYEPNPDESAVVLGSFYLPDTSYRGTPDCTVMAEYHHHGGGNLWLAYNDRLHQYTLGSNRHLPRLLMENRKMGAERYVFIWTMDNPPSNLLFMLRAMHNQRGQGEFATPFSEILSEQFQDTRGKVRTILNQAAALDWVTPIIRQEESLIEHMKLGGIFCYEVFPEGGITPMLARQMQHVLTCAGAHVIDEEGRDEVLKVGQQWISFSSLHEDQFREACGRP